jgi:hypothetical protein
VDDEVERPLPLRIVERRVSVRRAHLREQFSRTESTAERGRDEVLHEHVERRDHGARGSMRRSAAASRAAAASISSSACVGTTVIFDTAPG